MKEIRRKEIAAYINDRHSVTMEELCSAFHVSMNTVRADVAYLVSIGAANKVYGGVESCMERAVPAFSGRVTRNNPKKRSIAAAAARHIVPGDVIYIDSGTTAMYVAEHIKTIRGLTVVTGSLPVIRACAEMPNIELSVLPGALDRRTDSLKGPGSTLELARYNITRAFMGCTGISQDGRITVSTYTECEIKRMALQKSREVYLLADCSKFTDNNLMSYGTLREVTCLYTDEGISREALTLCKTRGVRYELV